MTKKPGLTLEQHRDVGCVLQKIHNIICVLRVTFGSAYPLKGNMAHAAAVRLESDMLDFRDLLENKCLAEHRSEIPFGLNTYHRNGDPDCPDSADLLLIKSINNEIVLRRQGGKK